MTTDPILWSPSTAGFFLAGISSAVPDDAAPVDPAHHAELMAACAAGASLVPCPRTGRPLAVAPAIDTRAALAAAIRREASRRIVAIAPLWRQMNDMREPSTAGAARFAAIDAIRLAAVQIEAALSAADEEALGQFAVSENHLWPDFKDPA